ncbi:hypothetical protein AAVH_07514 [Aphelenchoides avenae]|nr:hypothetical protein AAVH_07514 [Aphelenchus avenae]
MRSCPTQFIVWSALFLYWYATYVASFLRAFALGNWYIIVPEFLVFTAIWLLTMASLTMATFTAPPPIPDMFRIPFELWIFTNTSDAPSTLSSKQSTTSEATDPLNARIAAWANARSLPYSST